MTRLHIQVNQTMQFYRGQQGGSAPQRLFLSGGASVMPYTAQFFAEKLNVPVEYLNPFRNVQIDPSVNLEELSRVAHSLGEVVGLGLRNLAHCPVELNLIPESTRRMQGFNEKKPYLVATVFSLVAVVGAMGLLFQELAKVKQADLENNVRPKLGPLEQNEVNFKREYGTLQATTNELSQLTTWIENRYFWADVMTELRRVLIRTEQLSQQKFKTECGIWIEQFQTLAPGAVDSSQMAVPANPLLGPIPIPGVGPMIPESDNPYAAAARRHQAELALAQQQPAPVDPTGQPAAITLDLASPETNQISAIRIVVRAVDVSSVNSEANPQTLMGILESELQSSPMFDTNGTRVVSAVMPDDPAHYTYSFTVQLLLLRPLKL
jgi:hypothetical protein